MSRGGEPYLEPLLPKIWAPSAYADPNPTPAPNANAAQRAVGLLNNSKAEAAPAKDPYTNRRIVRSMHASHC